MSETEIESLERERAESGQRASFSGIVWVLAILLVAYPFSIGPAAWLHRNYPAARQAIEAIYAPLVFAADRSKLIGNVLEWYVEKVWMVR